MRGRVALHLALLSFFALSWSTAWADEPTRDGLNCDSVAWIDRGACANWKARNVDAKWSVRFSRDTGLIRTIYSNRAGKVPGLDLARITREGARSDGAIRALLAAYAKKRIHAFQDVLGIPTNRLNELVFADFRE